VVRRKESRQSKHPPTPPPLCLALTPGLLGRFVHEAAGLGLRTMSKSLLCQMCTSALKHAILHCIDHRSVRPRRDPEVEIGGGRRLRELASVFTAVPTAFCTTFCATFSTRRRLGCHEPTQKPQEYHQLLEVLLLTMGGGYHQLTQPVCKKLHVSCSWANY
jgi:hypothetical protein